MCNGGAFSEHLAKIMLPPDKRGGGSRQKSLLTVTYGGGVGESVRSLLFVVCRLSTHTRTYVYITCIIRVEFNDIKEDGEE